VRPRFRQSAVFQWFFVQVVGIGYASTQCKMASGKMINLVTLTHLIVVPLLYAAE
jgi:hypothetical protein